MLRLRGQFHLHGERTGDVRIQGLHQRAQAVSHLPGGKEIIPRELWRWWWNEAQAPDVSHNLRPVRQGNPGAVPAEGRSASLLQRLLQQNETGRRSVDTESEYEKGLDSNPAPFSMGGNLISARLPTPTEMCLLRVAGSSTLNRPD